MNAPSGGQLGSRAVSDFLLLNEEIAALVRARLPLETHLRSLAADLPKRSASLAQEIGRRLDAGETLADAMQGACTSLPAAYRAAIAAGVESGQLGGALESLADSATRMEQLRRVIGFAILYPLMIFVLFCVLLAIIVGVVAPSFGWLHQSHFGPFSELVGSPSVVFVLSVVLPAVVVLLAAVWWWRSARLGGGGSAGGVFGWLPWVRKARYWGQAATFSDLLSMLIERGLPLDRSLAMAAEATGNRTFIAASRDMAAHVQQGTVASSDMSASLRRAGFPPLVEIALRQVHDRQLLIRSLRQAAQMYHERAVRWAESFAENFPMLLTLVVGGTLTLGFTLSVFWPYATMLYELAEWNWR
jgi:general secretion pathway protein F